jgi:glycosyltransferase involved in cell wall biosynthesis
MTSACHPLSILMVTPRCLPEMGGIETHVHEVGIRLARQGHAVTILATDRGGGLPAAETVAGMAVRRVAAWPRRRDYYFAPALPREMARGQWDVVHVQGCHTLVAPLAMAAARWLGVPYVVTFHSGGHSSPLRNAFRRPQWLALGALVRGAAHCIGVSVFEAEFFRERMGLAEDKVSVVPNGAEMILLAEVAQPAEERGLIVSIGRLERYKGHHRVIEAFPSLLARRPESRLRIVGEGPYKRELLELVARLGLNDRVEIGGVPPAERARLAAIIGSAALVVLLSEYEAHPVAVMEALALNRRVLVTHGTGFMELVARGLVRSVPMDADAERIAEAMASELDCESPPLRADLATWDGCARQLVEVYRGVRPKGGSRVALASTGK